MLQTIEIRWFGNEPPGEGVRRWFESLGGPESRRSEERTDQYVALPGVDDLGMKFRGDQGFDVKARLEDIGTIELRLEGALIASGRVESWVKSSYPGGRFTALRDALACLQTVEVHKRRLQYFFELPADGGPEILDLAADPYPRIERGMALELAEVEVSTGSLKGPGVWTLGLEAFPGGPDLGSDMLAAARPLLVASPLELREYNSMGYPAWLAPLL